LEEEFLFDVEEEEVEHTSDSSGSDSENEIAEKKSKSSYLMPISREEANYILDKAGTLIPNVDNEIIVVNGPIQVTEAMSNNI
jgi:hypothetical protein